MNDFPIGISLKKKMWHRRKLIIEVNDGKSWELHNHNSVPWLLLRNFASLPSKMYESTEWNYCITINHFKLNQQSTESFPHFISTHLNRIHTRSPRIRWDKRRILSHHLVNRAKRREPTVMSIGPYRSRFQALLSSRQCRCSRWSSRRSVRMPVEACRTPSPSAQGCHHTGRKEIFD